MDWLVENGEQLLLVVSDVTKLQLGCWPLVRMVFPKPLSKNAPDWCASRCGCRCRGGCSSWTCRRCRRRTWCWRWCGLAGGASEQIIQHRILVLAAAVHPVLILIVHDDNVRVLWQV